MKSKVQYWEGMYSRPLEELPWEIPKPPKELSDFLGTHNVKSGTALDIGCGTGNYSLFLAKKGFQVTGIDFSTKALAVARRRARQNALKIKLVRGDATRLVSVLKGKTFDFIFDYSLLHHISDQKVAVYAKQFKKLLKPDGFLLMICYSDTDNFAKGKPTAQGKYGNTMYYRTRKETEHFYKDLKLLSYKKAKLGKRLHHKGHCFVFSQKEKPWQ